MGGRALTKGPAWVGGLLLTAYGSILAVGAILVGAGVLLVFWAHRNDDLEGLAVAIGVYLLFFAGLACGAAGLLILLGSSIRHGSVLGRRVGIAATGACTVFLLNAALGSWHATEWTLLAAVAGVPCALLTVAEFSARSSCEVAP